MEKLFARYVAEAPKYFCRRWVKQGNLPDFPEITFEAVLSLEGDKLKRSYNPMLRRQRMQPKPGSYQVQERYGLWICKDYIPVQRKNEWITTRGQEFTRFHAFVNCQALKLTANRGSIENTPSERLGSLEREVRKLYDEILETDDWTNLEWLESQAQGHQTQEKEKKDWERRVEHVKKLKRASYKGVKLIEPRLEQGVYALAVALQAVEPDLFPFDVVDYDTHVGIDVLAKTRDAIEPSNTHLKYVEFKHTVTNSFNHSFKYLYGIVCWKTQLRHEEEVEDIAGVKRRLIIAPPSSPGAPTRYLLDAADALHKIEVFVLEDYLREKLGLSFR